MNKKFMGRIISKLKKSIFFKILNTILIIFSKKYILLNFHEDYYELNFGDQLNYYICKELFNKIPIPYWNVFNLFNEPVYSFIGSVLDNYKKANLIVWGSGYMNQNSPNLNDPIIKAVRGPKTQLKLNLNSTTQGDLGLLLPLIYDPKIKKKYKLGLIPHFLDFEGVKAKYFSELKKNKNITLIDFRTNDFITTLNIILSCESIISSSLHGLVISDAYKIPNRWVSFSSQIKGGGIFKFIDYLNSVGRYEKISITINSFEDIMFIDFNDYKEVSFNSINLLNSSPLNIVNEKVLNYKKNQKNI